MASPAGTRTDGGSEPLSVKVWDPFVRFFHWSLVAAFAVAFTSADEWDELHQWAGYAAAGLVALRIIWGFVGSEHARFSSFVRRPVVTIGYLRDALTGHGQRYLGHNPAGGAMVLALIIGIGGLGLTGYGMTVGSHGEEHWLEELHEGLANGVLVLIALHVTGVLVMSIKHGENLVRSMITGRKRS